jgi:hypothetical protein
MGRLVSQLIVETKEPAQFSFHSARQPACLASRIARTRTISSAGIHRYNTTYVERPRDMISSRRPSSTELARLIMHLPLDAGPGAGQIVNLPQ